METRPEIRSTGSWWCRRLRDERGQSLILFVLGLPLIIGIAALAIDLAILYQARNQVQIAADAGSLAGAQDIVNDTVSSGAVSADAQTWAKNNIPGYSPSTSTITVTTPYNNNANEVAVTVSKKVPMTFANFFGLGSETVSATSVATSDLTTPLGYFGGDNSDLEDGTKTPDGWDNFCANNTYDQVSNSDSNSDDPLRCPANPSSTENTSLDGWIVAHGGVDISPTTSSTQGKFYSPPGTTDQMVDLLGTCVEDLGNWPSASGSTSRYTQLANQNNVNGKYQGYCMNNSDGELEQKITTVGNSVYTVNFWMGSNTGGFPQEKPMMAAVATQDLESLPAMADTNGNDNANATVKYGTTYPLETSSYWSNSSVILYHNEYFYIGPSDGNKPDWVYETFQFTSPANGGPVWIGFGSLVNCTPDWVKVANVNNTTFYPAGSSASSPQVATSTTFVTPPAQVSDLLGAQTDNGTGSGQSNITWQNKCEFGPGISDITVIGPDAEQLTQ